MTNVRDPVSLSRLEVLVLARLSTTKSTSMSELTQVITELAPEGGGEPLAMSTLESLCHRGLATSSASGSSRRSTRGSRRRTEQGTRALQAALGLTKAPEWREVRDVHLPALALSTKPGVDVPRKVLKTAGGVACAVLSAHYGTPPAASPNALCDALIAEKLGMGPLSGPLTLGQIRTYVLAQCVNAKGEHGTPADLVMHLALEKLALGAPKENRAYKLALTQALARRWLAGQRSTRGADTAPPPETAPPPRDPPNRPTAPATAPELLELVRNAIPNVGADGRFGAEKVFVSAIWRNLERERRIPELSLDRFKQWLLSANREGKLILARADMISAMDARLVAESAIEDQGATFHFVLDRRPANTAGRVAHAR